MAETKKKIKCARPECKEMFVPSRPHQRYHDPKCRNAHFRETHKWVKVEESNA